MPSALEAATQMVIELCGGTASETVSAGAEPAWRRTARLRFDRLLSFGGADIPRDEAERILRSLGFNLAGADEESITVHVPLLAQRCRWPRRAGAGTGDPCRTRRPGPRRCRDHRARGRSRRGGAAHLGHRPHRAGVAAAALGGADGHAYAATGARGGGAPRAGGQGPRRGGDLQLCRQPRGRAVWGSARGAAAGQPRSPPISTSCARPPLITLALAAARNAARGFGDVGLFEVGPRLP